MEDGNRVIEEHVASLSCVHNGDAMEKLIWESYDHIGPHSYNSSLQDRVTQNCTTIFFQNIVTVGRR